MKKPSKKSNKCEFRKVIAKLQKTAWYCIDVWFDGQTVPIRSNQFYLPQSINGPDDELTIEDDGDQRSFRLDETCEITKDGVRVKNTDGDVMFLRFYQLNEIRIDAP
jgi:hypothetical protein